MAAVLPGDQAAPIVVLMHKVQLTFDQLVLIYKSLEAVRTLSVLPQGDELLAETIEIVDRALEDAVRAPAKAA